MTTRYVRYIQRNLCAKDGLCDFDPFDIENVDRIFSWDDQSGWGSLISSHWSGGFWFLDHAGVLRRAGQFLSYIWGYFPRKEYTVARFRNCDIELRNEGKILRLSANGCPLGHVDIGRWYYRGVLSTDEGKVFDVSSPMTNWNPLKARMLTVSDRERRLEEMVLNGCFYETEEALRERFGLNQSSPGSAVGEVSGNRPKLGIKSARFPLRAIIRDKKDLAPFGEKTRSALLAAGIWICSRNLTGAE